MNGRDISGWTLAMKDTEMLSNHYFSTKKQMMHFLNCLRFFQSETLDQSRRGKSADTTSVFAIFAAIASRIKRAKRGLLLSKYRHDLFRPKNWPFAEYVQKSKEGVVNSCKNGLLKIDWMCVIHTSKSTVSVFYSHYKIPCYKISPVIPLETDFLS